MVTYLRVKLTENKKEARGKGRNMLVIVKKRYELFTLDKP